MIRNTSIDTYNSVVNSKLSKARKEVYEALYKIGNGTANEIFVNGGLQRITHNASINSRLLELKEMGLVTEIGTKRCSITGNTVINYTTTDCKNFTRYVNSKLSYSQRLKKFREELYDLEKNSCDVFASAAFRKSRELAEGL